MTVLAAEGLHTFYGKSHILHGVGLTVGEGEIVTLLGRNGAGKSTTLRSLVGLTPAREGSVRIFGQATTAWPPDRIVALLDYATPPVPAATVRLWVFAVASSTVLAKLTRLFVVVSVSLPPIITGPA